MLAFKPVNNFQDYYFTNDKEKPITAQYVEITRYHQVFNIREEIDHQILKIRKNIKYFIKL